MTKPSTHTLEQIARQAGYRVASVERLRHNRWLLTLADKANTITLVLAQARPLIGSADVQDLAEFARLRRPDTAVLLAIGGAFSPNAHLTLSELRDRRMQLCTDLPPAAAPMVDEPRPRGILFPSN